MQVSDDSFAYSATQEFIIRMPLRHRHEFTELTTYQSVFESLPALLSDHRFKFALQLSSSSLLEQLERLVRGAVNLNDPRSQKALRSLRKYLIRMTRRATPFGFMSGVAIGQFTDASTLRPNSNPIGIIEVFPDYAWLMNITAEIAKLDKDGCLPIFLNPYIRQLGERLDVAHANAFSLGQSVHVDLRVTSATDTVVELAAVGASRSEIIEELLARHEGVDRDTIVAFVDDLIRNGIISEKLQPGLEAGRELSSILSVLSKFSTLGEYSDALSKLDSLCRSISTVADLHSYWDDIQQIQNAISGEVSIDDRISINSSLSLQETTLHENVARRVEQVANLLVNTDFYPQRLPYLVEYEHHFLERYGVEGEVPILELLSASCGLEAPDTYRLPPRTYPLSSYSPVAREQRTTALIDAYAKALQCGSHLDLSDELLATYATSDFRPPNPTLEFFVQVLSSSRESLERDDFDLFVIPDGLAQGGRSIGRFARLLGQDAYNLLNQLFDQEASQSETLLVQLRYMPDKARMANVARTTDLGLKLLSLGTAEESELNLNDIHVGNDGSRFYLRDASSGRRLRIIENHMMSTLNAPNVVRLMVDISNDWYRSFNMFDWGVLRDASFLPRVTRGRIILSPAQWNVKSDILKKIDGCAYSCRVTQLQESLGFPDRVAIVQGDNRLPLDLRTEIDRDILDDEIIRAQKMGGSLSLEETIAYLETDLSDTVLTNEPALREESWLRDDNGHTYDHELVVPVIWTGNKTPVPMSPRKLAASRISYKWDNRWVCLDIFGGLQNLDSIVGLELTELRSTTQFLAPTWFFIRYSMPAHKLRIRLWVNDENDTSSVRSALLEWAHSLFERSMIYDYALVSFVPEVNRFGGDAAYEQALSVFSASSELANFISQLRVTGSLSGIPDDILGVYILISCGNSMSLTPSDLSSNPSKEKEFREYYRLHRQRLVDILARGRLRELEDEDQASLQALSSKMAVAMKFYSTEVVNQCLSPAQCRSAFASMIHMIFNRAFPIGNAVEQRSLDLWTLASDAYCRRLQALNEKEAQTS